MILHNLRLGLATNSSSTHSLVFLKGAKDREANGEYGWNHFTLASRKAKKDYLAILLQHALARSLPDNIAKIVMERWVGDLPTKGGYIDHQSVYELPCAFGTDVVDEKFFEEFGRYILQDELVILGGNDNDDEQHPLSDGSFVLPMARDWGRSKFVCRKDDLGYWVIFNQDNGDKVRFSLPDKKAKATSYPHDSASTPELVDIKITDWCNFGCPFCYQGSTTKGRHADNIYELAVALAELKVFEVALGGGETTSHPRFLDFLGMFRKAGIVPNFTTKSLAWLKDASFWPVAMRECGAFAFSAVDRKDVRQLAALLEINGIAPEKASVQIILGVVAEHEFYNILMECHRNNIRLTILGYKAIRRGLDWKPKEHGWWLGMVTKAHKENKCPHVGIDTVVAAEYQDDLAKSGVPDYMYTTQEGRFSCYIDAVANKIGPSSYCDESEMDDLDATGKGSDWKAAEIRILFKSFSDKGARP